MAKKVQQSGELWKGLITAVDKAAIPDGASPSMQNVDFARAVGTISKRKGIALEATGPVDAFTKVTGLYQFIKSTGTKQVMATAGNDIYEVTAGVFTSRFTGLMAATNCNFATFKDLLIFVNENETTRKWTGAGAFDPLLGTPPANAKFVIVFKNRVFIANTSAGKSRLHFSADGNPEDWVTVNNAGFIDINLDDGDQITGLGVIGGTLMIFKRFTAHALFGYKPDNFTIRQIQTARGCVSGRTIVNMGTVLVYLSDTGVQSLSSSGASGEIMPAIRFDIENLPAKATAVGGRLRREFILAYDSDADGKNDSAYVLDLPTGSWSFWSNIKANVFLTQDDESLLSGASEIKNLRRHDTGEDDEGSAIDFRWRTKAYDMGDMTALKFLDDIYVYCKPISAKNLTIKMIIDGVQVDSTAFLMTAHQTNATDETIKVIATHGVDTVYGRFIQFEFANAELAAPVQIFQYNFQAEVAETRQLTPT